MMLFATPIRQAVIMVIFIINLVLFACMSNWLVGALSDCNWIFCSTESSSCWLVMPTCLLRETARADRAVANLISSGFGICCMWPQHRPATNVSPAPIVLPPAYAVCACSHSTRFSHITPSAPSDTTWCYRCLFTQNLACVLAHWSRVVVLALNSWDSSSSFGLINQGCALIPALRVTAAVEQHLFT